MLKQILNLDGAQELSKKEQKFISGGRAACGYLGMDGVFTECSDGNYCYIPPTNQLPYPSGYCKPEGPILDF